MSSTPFRIIIVGGGIAGMSAAIALRAPNREITILEQSQLHAEIGATISLQPNATRILEQTWGLDDLLDAARGTVDHGFRIYNVDGTLVNEVPLLKKPGYDSDRIMWHRQDLHGHLKKAALSPKRHGSPAVLRTSSRVVGCDCEAGHVSLESGEVLEADVIVGADGIHSIMRRFVVGERVQAVPTGTSAYRLMVPTHVLEAKAPEFCSKIDPRAPYTSMMMAHDCRLVMGPARDGDPNGAQSWVTEGDGGKMLDTFGGFPEWTRSVLREAESIGLWQLRDIEALKTWTRGRVILIGDAAHAMLPTQGQGASQTVEDAEALGAYFGGFDGKPSAQEVAEALVNVFDCRFERASLIQRYSREAAKPATVKGSKEIKMRPDEFMDYNCLYRGAVEWQKRHSVLSSA